MEYFELIVNFILAAGMTLAALMVIFILKTKQSFSKRLPAIFFAAGFFFALYYYAFMHRAAVLGGIAIIFGQGMGFLLGPSLLFFVRSLKEKKDRIIKPYLIQLVPYFTHWLVVSLPLGLSLIFHGLLSAYGQSIADYADFINLFENAFFLFYIVLAYREIKRTEQQTKQAVADIEAQDLGWCKTLLFGIAFIVVADSLLSVYELIYPPLELVWNPGLIIAILMVVFFAILGYKGTVQSKILLPDFLLESKEKPPLKSDTVGESLFSEKEAAALKSELMAVMEEERPYLDEKLTLGDLARKINLTDKRLSELLNKHLNTNFYDFINQYRVETFKTKVVDDAYAHLSLLGLAYESGFKSKTSFNRVFKQSTGLSPSEYKKVHAPVRNSMRA